MLLHLQDVGNINKQKTAYSSSYLYFVHSNLNNRLPANSCNPGTFNRRTGLVGCQIRQPRGSHYPGSVGRIQSSASLLRRSYWSPRLTGSSRSRSWSPGKEESSQLVLAAWYFYLQLLLPKMEGNCRNLHSLQAGPRYQTSKKTNTSVFTLVTAPAEDGTSDR